MHPLLPMKPRSFLFPLAVLSAATALSANAQLLITEIQSDGLSDFWELTNTGAAPINLGNWKWIDSARNPADSDTVTIASGTSIAPGESIIFTATAATTFRSQWGLSSSVQVIVGGPGFGKEDGVALYNASGVEQFYFTYAKDGFTLPNGSLAIGGHAGASAGGATGRTLVWNPSSGTSSPRYSAATGTTLGTFTAPGSATNVGSPGYSGLTTGSGPQVTLSLSATVSSFSESAANPASVGTVTRAAATASPLVVNLSSSDTTEATVPATVTIPANQTSVTFNITAVNDTFPDGTKTAILTATAIDANSAILNVTVLDNDGDVLDKDFMLTEIQSNQSSGKPSGANDYWELTNIGTTTRDISGYSWHDGGRSGASAAAYKLPAGSTIAAGESVIFTDMAPAAFRAWWGIPNSVQVFQSVGAPGLGKDDGISFFDAGQNELFFFSYALGGFIREDGSTSLGGHAGASAGVAADSQALVWVPTSGTTSPRYTFATGSNYSSFSAVSPATDLGSPGSKGVFVPTVSIGNASVVEGNSGTTTLSLDVTRTNADTAFTVAYAVTGGTAASGSDFVPLASGILTFANGGATTQPIQIQVNGDVLPESDETVVVTLSNVAGTIGNTVLATTVGTGTIVNDDAILPGITTQPVPTSIASGGTTTLTVAASGFPAPTFQWYIGTSGDTSQPIAGATSASLVTPAITANTRFWVRITNTAGFIDSSAALVTVVSGATTIDLSTYVRVGRYALPEPTRTALPAGTPASNLLCQEASGVAYNWDTDTLFIVGDGGRSVTQVTKTGELVDTMTLALGSSPQGTDFYDPEGITYLGNGQFVFSEERDRQLVKFTYAAGTTLSRSGAKTVKLGTFVNNTGLEGFCYDPQTGGFICLKEISPLGIFQTGVDFDAGTATNGSPTTVNSIDLFNPALLGMSDFGDVFALSNLPSMTGQPQSGNLLVLSQEAARIVNTDRLGNIHSSLQIVADPGSPLSAGDQQHEGLTMDRSGRIYVVNENGGGDIDHPQLWVYAPASGSNQAPTAVSIGNPVNALLENSSTVVPVKLGDILVTDDGQGTNALSLTGADAAFFEIINSGLYLKAGTVLDYETKTSYSVTVRVDDSTVGTTPDASVTFTLSVTDVVDESSGTPVVFISEVHPTGSSTTTYKADWIEITNAGTSAVNIAGWQMDDNSDGTAKVPLRGLTSIPAGKSAVFFEGTADGSTDAAIIASFSTTWFGTPTPPAGFLIGAYGGGGVGLSSGGDSVNVFDAAGNRVAGVSFDAATSNVTFDNKAGVNGKTLPLPLISQKSVSGINGAFVSANSVETGSPGTTGRLLITEVAPWSSSSPVGADWFEVTNSGATTVDLTGWKVDDSSESPAGAVALNGVASIAPGERVIFLETATPNTTIPLFLSNWFGANPPAGLKVGSYSGSGIGLSATDGDAVNLYDSTNVRQANVSFGAAASGPFATFDNAVGVSFGPVTKLSIPGVNGSFIAKGAADQIGSPGYLTNSGPLDFALWLEVNGLRSSGFANDSNRNGVTDGVEFFFNLKKTGGLGNLPVLTTVGGEKQLVFTTLDGAVGITGSLEHSDDLGQSDVWAPAMLNVDYEVVGTTSAGGQTTTTLRLLGNAGAKFWRHRVTQN